MNLKVLFFKFWKHKGACIVMGIRCIYEIVIAVFLILEEATRFTAYGPLVEINPIIKIMIVPWSLLWLCGVWWIIANLFALLFCFRIPDTIAREKWYKRIVIWCLFIFLILVPLYRVASRFIEDNVSSV